jgi:hypothetical protein
MDYLDKEKAVAYLEKMENETRSVFDRIRQENYNDNTKGYDYENTLKEFYSLYLCSGFDFFVRRPILDINLRVESVLKRKNEFDILATYKSAIPRLIYKIKDTNYIPYDSVAFITEVKQTLTKPNLKKDLEKFHKLDKLELGQRFKYMSFPFLRQRPERILFYYERRANPSTILDLLSQKDFVESWDIVTILKDDILIINKTNYVQKEIMKKDTWAMEKKFPLLKTMMYATYPNPYMVNSWDLIINLIRSSMHAARAHQA